MFYVFNVKNHIKIMFFQWKKLWNFSSIENEKEYYSKKKRTFHGIKYTETSLKSEIMFYLLYNLEKV